MKLLFVSRVDRYARAVATITKYAGVGKALGHEVALFSEQRSEPPLIECSLDVKRFDYAIFVIYQPADFPDLPYLAQVLDGMPKERRVIIDCCGRYNETVRVEHDFNHLEKLDGHQGWEWVEGFQAVSDRILQPTLSPLRQDVTTFLFHGFDPASVVRPYSTASEAARTWASGDSPAKDSGAVYVGNNWQRWTQVRWFLKSLDGIRDELGPVRLAGWDWDKRPEWAAQLGIEGVDVDPALLERLGVQTAPAIPYDEVIDFLGHARFSPVFHRPLFKHLGLVTNRMFETFCADTIPLLALPADMVERIFGPDARPLLLDGNVTARLRDMLRKPEQYWDAVLKTRAYLADHHSYQHRFQQLLAILDG